MVSRFLPRLLAWYAANGRDLPWRHTRDPYAIWLSEIILQQTRVAQGMDYWRRFMEVYPTVESLAKASEDDVLRLWQGLGYYSRARHLHAAARQIVAEGGFPNTLGEIRRLKGVGDYTAAAIGAFAFGLPVMAIDGNAYRVLARLNGVATPINTGEGKHEFEILANEAFGIADPAEGEVDMSMAEPDEERLRPANAFGETFYGMANSAMMDFGSLVCTPKSSACLLCPFAEDCVALRSHQVEQLPVKLKKLKIRSRHFRYYYIRCNGQTAIRQRGAGDIWQGLWEPLMVEEAESMQAAKAPQQPVLPWLEQLSPRLLRAGVKHVLTHQVIHADFYLVEADSRPALPDGYIWIAETDIGHYAVPRLVERLLTSLPDK